MTDKIDVKKVARLARLNLTPEEEKDYTEKFQQVLGYVDQIAEVVIEGELSTKDESLQQLYRPDQAIDSSVHPKDFSPYLENQFFKVPPIIE